jgi:hypothetical protein
MKFQRIDSFKCSSIGQDSMKKITGGVDPTGVTERQLGKPSGGGTICESMSSSGCVAYSTDVTTSYLTTAGTTAYITTFQGLSEISLAC